MAFPSLTGNPLGDFHYGRWLLRYKLPPVLGLVARSKKKDKRQLKGHGRLSRRANRRPTPRRTSCCFQGHPVLRTCILGPKVTRIKI
jgi:hypothetical protein